MPGPAEAVPSRGTMRVMTHNHPPLPPLLLTVKDAAKTLAVSPRTLYQLLDNGSLESVHIGACRRIPAAALEDYVARLRAEQAL